MDTPENVRATLGALTAAFFQCVSFDERSKPRYEGLYDLFVEGGQLIKNTAEPPDISTVDQFIAPRQKMVDAGELTFFKETELAEITEIFGSIAHRFSTYEKRGSMNGAVFDVKGMISTQFIRTPNGWKMTSMAWDDERPGLIIPDRYQ